MVNLIFVGPQGSGKGTQAKIIAKKLGITHISTGDLLRASTGKLRKLADSYIHKGELVPSKVMIEILKQRLEKSDCKEGFILDGFPRTIEQAEDLEKITKIDLILEIDISDGTAVKRLQGRWNCKKCNIAYNIVTCPKPKKLDVCDVCGAKLYQREDDANEDAIKKRLKIYHEDTEPMLKKYPFVKINGEQSIEKITKDILKEIGKLKKP